MSKLTKKVIKNFIKIYKDKILNDENYDELYVRYTESQNVFECVENKIVKSKRKTFKRVVNEYLNEIANNFIYYLGDNTSDATIDHIITMTSDEDEFDIEFLFSNQRIDELISKVIANSWK